MPKLILQPLAENAIVHGLEPSDTPVHIQLSAMVTHSSNSISFILLSVINDGAPYHPNSKDGNKRIGLRNVKERLIASYPDSFLYIKGGEGKFTEFHILIPYI